MIQLLFWQSLILFWLVKAGHDNTSSVQFIRWYIAHYSDILHARHLCWTLIWRLPNWHKYKCYFTWLILDQFQCLIHKMYLHFPSNLKMYSGFSYNNFWECYSKKNVMSGRKRRRSRRRSRRRRIFTTLLGASNMPHLDLSVISYFDLEWYGGISFLLNPHPTITFYILQSRPHFKSTE